ncbi:hypothetical protein LJB42_003566 [Komagataella kurtzmanii]|nr:hypothetical protein LJB42_003566 [Komagataella kurtzmanii]
MAIFGSRLVRKDDKNASGLGGPSPSNTNLHSSPVKLSISLESPPVVLYGQPHESTGSILSGLLSLDVLSFTQIASPTMSGSNSPGILTPVRSTSSLNVLTPTTSLTTSQDYSKLDSIEIVNVTLSFVQTITYGKPLAPPSNTLQNCPDCKQKKLELARWDILAQPTSFAKGAVHAYPFSHLLPGALPATTLLGNTNTVIKYELVADAEYLNVRKKPEYLRIKLPIIIKRSILRGPDRNSLRVFPPTDVTATAVLPNVVYPKSTFPIELRLDNVCTKYRRWRMRKLVWRMEEHIKVRAVSCEKHETKLKVLQDYANKQHHRFKRPHNTGGQTFTHLSVGTASGHDINTNGPINPVRTVTTEEEVAITPAAGGIDHVALTQEALAQEQAREYESRYGGSAANSNSENHNNNTNSSNTENSNIPIDHFNDERGSNKPVLFLEEIRTISQGEIKSGWKSDFSGKGVVELVADINIMNLSSIALDSSLSNLSSVTSQNCNQPMFNHDDLFVSSMANCSCDLSEKELGAFVSHLLVVEIVVAEELIQRKGVTHTHRGSNSQAKSPSVRFGGVNGGGNAFEQTHSSEPADDTDELRFQLSNNSELPVSEVTSEQDNDSVVGIATGVARVLRMQFKVLLTERSGLGVSWDDEVPPTYENVSALSPPTYDQARKPEGPMTGEDLTPPTHPAGAHTRERETPLNSSPSMVTPGVLYGIGDTPGVSIDGVLQLDDAIQELKLS